MNSRMPLPGIPAPARPGPQRRHEDGNGYLHFEDCPDGSPERVEWVCDEGHWFTWDIPPGVGDQCPVVFHDATSDSRCVGTLSRPECVCVEEDWRR